MMKISLRWMPVVLCLAAGTPAVWAVPSVSGLSPAVNAAVSTLAGLSVTFSEPVTGVDAADLTVAGTAAAGVTGSGAGPYVFTFTQPAPGSVSAAWESDHGIAGLGTGAFDPAAGTGGISWSYTLADTLPPVIASITTSVPGQEMPAILPQPGSTVAVLTAISVTFSESVTGVEAGDLLVNGTPCATVTGEGAGPWVFTFASPGAGTVAFDWTAAPGIVDGAGNSFAGTPWNVTKVAAQGTVIITEFLAANGGVTTANTNGIRDENFDLSGYVELTNTGAATVDLLGWGLTDDPTVPFQWILPSRSLAAGARLIVWVSGKDRKPAAAAAIKHLHANFSLNPNGGSLALVPPDAPYTSPASAFANYPPQRYDYSYGPQAGDGALRYFSPPSTTQTAYTLPTSGNPTPTAPVVPGGAANPASALTALAADPSPSVRRGYFSEPFQLVLSAPDAGATVRYTLNGSIPTAASPAYTAPLTVSSTTVLRMVAFSTGLVPSNTVTHSYLFPGNVISQPSPPYDNPALTTDNTNPPLPVVGGTALPIAWGSQSGVAFPGLITNLSTDQVPADYGMDPKVYADPTKYADNGTVDAINGRTNGQRIANALRTLPMLSVVLKSDDMFGASGIYPNAGNSAKPDLTKPCSLELLQPDGTTGFSVDAGIDLHGNASRSPGNSPKHGFTLKFKGKYGTGELQAALFPDSPAREWDKLVLRADYNSSWVHWDGSVQRPKGIRIRDAWAKETFRDMGRMAGHHRFTNLFINGIYWGTYDLSEDQTGDFGANYLGGKEDDYDVIDQDVLKNGTWTVYRNLKSLLGWTGAATGNLTTPPTLPGTAFTNTQLEQIKQYLDLPWFMDYMIHHYFTGHEDWGTTTDYSKNWYAIRGKNGTFKYLPWDQENLLWDPSVNRINGALYPPSAIHPRLNTNSEYKLLFADRVQRHLISPDGALLPAANIARLDAWASIMNADAMCLESARWGDYRYKVHQRSSGPYTEVYSWNGKWYENNVLRSNTANTNNWLSEINRLKNAYFPARTATMITQFRTAGLYPALNAPQFRNLTDDALTGSRAIASGYQLKLGQPPTAPSGTVNGGTIYYTLDGTDPRVAYTTTGQVTAGALAYTSPLTLNTTTTVKARSLNGSVWSALMEATFSAGSPLPAVRFTEIHYNAKGSLGGSAAEFLELQNTGTSPVDLGNWSLEGIDFIFPIGSIIQPGARVVVASNDNPAVFAAQYPGTVVFGYYKGPLSNGGERLSLLDATGLIVTTVEYDDESPWPNLPDGQGYSLENINPAGDPQNPLSWRASLTLKGSPGAPNQSAPAATVIISEFLARNAGAWSVAGTTPDFVELYNAGPSPVDLSHWVLTANPASPLVIPPGSALPVGGYLVFPFYSSLLPDASAAGYLSDNSGIITLSTATLQPVDSVRYGPQIPDFSFSRIGGAWALTLPNPGTTGSAAPTAPLNQLRLNEWLANPPPGGSDWLELFNLHATLPAGLSGLHLGTSTQLFRYDLPAAVAPRGFAVFLAGPGTGPDTLPFTLPANGTTLRLLAAGGDSIDSLAYSGQAEGVSQGRLPDGTGAIVPLAFPSPRSANYSTVSGGPLLNEILAINRQGANSPWATRPGWLEIKNPTAATLNLAGWKLSGSGPAWSFPAGCSLAPGAVLALWCDPATPPSQTNAPALNCGLDLTSGADREGVVELANPDSQITDRAAFGWQIPDFSLGRTGDGSWQLASVPTRGSTNAAAAALTDSPVRLNEWLAAPGLLFSTEFVELHNPGTRPASVGGMWLTDDPSEPGLRQWRIPANSFIAAGKQIWFKTGLSGNSAVAPFGIDQAGDSLRLGAADAPATLVDTVSFGGTLPATSSGRLPDGGGLSGSALAPTPGQSNTGSSAGPVFITHPADAALPLGGSVVLAASATSGTLQWRRNGTPIAAGPGLSLGPLTLADDAIYTCTATDGAFTTTSLPARVMVLTTYQAWATATGAGTGDADPDHDGISNFMEFLTGGSPFVPQTLPLAPGPLTGNPPTTITLDFLLNRRASYQDLTGELSSDLALWLPTPPISSEVLSETSNGDQQLRWSFPVPPSSLRHFLRLRLNP